MTRLQDVKWDSDMQRLDASFPDQDEVHWKTRRALLRCLHAKEDEADQYRKALQWIADYSSDSMNPSRETIIETALDALSWESPDAMLRCKRTASCWLIDEHDGECEPCADHD